MTDVLTHPTITVLPEVRTEAPLVERLVSAVSMVADSPTPVVAASRRLNRAAGIIATSVLIDSAMEHYRGNFHNTAMWTPLVTSSLSIAVSVHGLSDAKHGAQPLRDLVYIGAGLVGAIGTGFHIYNVIKKPGGFTWQNVFYSAPLGAPAAMSLAGLMGFLAERVRDNSPAGEPSVFGLPAGRVVAAATALSLLGTTAEAGLLHFRGAFHNPAMLLPVTMPPVAAGLLATATFGAAAIDRRGTRGWLAATAAMGVAGVALHAYGVSRGMGGWRNWRQNLFAGPPLPAPPSFTGLSLAGIAALALLKERSRD
ncbi:hypothetical protein [Sphingomonas sp. CROZ-RG-20F-R02-07]|uniref:hypothetical protein n=1 Tax=Sphingomonas sp. CROZ-RG-20F-R02-07 TaxID=2914832 RepID=UPI001F5847DC